MVVGGLLLIALAVTWDHWYVRPCPPFVGLKARPRPFLSLQQPQGRLDTDAGVPTLTARGEGVERAAFIGLALKNQIQHLRVAYFPRYFQGVLEESTARANRMIPYLEADEVAALNALANASGVSFDEALLFSTFLDVQLTMGCSTLGVLRPVAAGGPLLGRNLDFGSFGVADGYDVLVIEKPPSPREKEYAFASVTWPGVLGVLSGMNEHGLALALMVSLDGPRKKPGVPTLLLLRRVLRRAKTVREAVEMMRQAPIASANNVMVIDATGEATVAELSPLHSVFREPEAGVIAAANSFLHPVHAGSGPCQRYRALMQGAQGKVGVFTVEMMQELLESTALGPMNLQAMVFAPTSRRAWLSLESIPAGAGPYQAIDLSPLFDR